MDAVNIQTVGLYNTVEIELYGSDGKLKHKESGSNIVRDWYNYAQRFRNYRDVSRKGNLAHIRNYFAYISNNGAFDCIYLTNHTETPNATDAGIDYNTMNQSRVIGHAARQDMTISDSKKGVMVKTNCYETDDSVVMEYQWGVNQAVGSFSAILHSRLYYTYMDGVYLRNPIAHGITNITFPYKSKQMYGPEGKPFNPMGISNGGGDSSGVCVFGKLVNSVGRKFCLVTKEFVGSDILRLIARPFGAYGTTLPDISAVIDLPWQASYFSGALPTGYGIVSSGEIIVVVVSNDVRYNTSLIFKSTDNGLTWASPVEHSYIKDSIWTDGTYLYGQTWNNGNLYRVPLLNITNSSSEYVVLDSRYIYHNGKLRYSTNPSIYVDMATIDWIAHTHGGYLTENITQHGISYCGSATIGNSAYRYYNVSTEGGDTSYPLFELDLTSQPAWYTAHYELSSPINKAAEETLVVRYTFNISEA